MKKIQETITCPTSNHSTFINRAGVILVESPDDRGLCVRIEPRDALAHAEFLLEHRAELEQLQKDLDERWNAIAKEVAAYMEEQEPGSFLEASQFGFRDALESLVETGTGRAAEWYPSLFDESGEPTTFEQEWGPFLRICKRMQGEDAETGLYDDRTASVTNNGRG